VSDQSYVIGVDVGGTNTRLAVGTPDGEYVIVSKFLARSVPQLKSGLEKIVGNDLYLYYKFECCTP
jgi:N-acetylglucosamine kinase-like BadF-type ATPase